MKIKAGVLNGPHEQFSIENIEVDGVLQPHELLVKILAIEICQKYSFFNARKNR